MLFQNFFQILFLLSGDYDNAGSDGDGKRGIISFTLSHDDTDLISNYNFSSIEKYQKVLVDTPDPGGIEMDSLVLLISLTPKMYESVT